MSPTQVIIGVMLVNRMEVCWVDYEEEYPKKVTLSALLHYEQLEGSYCYKHVAPNINLNHDNCFGMSHNYEVFCVCECHRK